ncbi:reverse transcriptase domain-containing protein [Tanacetum coccineum]
MKEVHSHDWLSNPVMVTKHDGSWRMCVDFKDLNKAYPKDGYPLLEIDWKVESLSIQANEAVYRRAPHVGRTNGKGRTHFLPGSGKRNGKHSLDDGKGNQENAHILCQQGIKKSENKLHIDGKISVGLGACQPEVARSLQKWSIKLGEYAIHYRPRVSVKGQILADFIVERPEEDSSDTLIEIEEELPDPWILFTDGSSYTDGSGAGLILTDPEGTEFTYALRFRFDATKNKAEYKALISRLRIEKQIGVKNL